MMKIFWYRVAAIFSLSLFLLQLLTSPVWAAASATTHQTAFDDGVQAAQAGDFATALQLFSEAIQSDPSAPVYANRCLVNLQLGQNAAALKDCTQAIQLQPAMVEAFLNRGLASYRLGDYPAAIADYSHMLKLQPLDFRAYFNRGLARAELAEFSAAIADYNRALSLQPEPPAQAEIQIDRALAEASQHHWQRAMADLNQAIDLNPGSDRAYYNRGYLNLQRGNYLVGIQDLTHSLQLNPDNPEAHLDRGVAHYQLGDAQHALTDLQQAAAVFLRQGKTLAYQRAQALIWEIRQAKATAIG